MTFVSYAQNYEDVILYRVLKHVKNGFYIDVGANHPVEDSVTKAFYDLGWQGINIEPLESYITLLDEARPRDKNIQCALSDSAGSLDIWSCDVRGWETLDKSVAEEHEGNGFHGKWAATELKTLAEITHSYSPSEVHFLKVDVEGHEKQVLFGADFKSFRPWVIVVEASLPGTAVENYDEWEFILVNSNYRFVYADGINRFYLAEEQRDLEKLFKYPPNVFDEFTTHKELSLADWAQNNEFLVLQARAEVDDLRRQKAQLEDDYANLEDYIAKLEGRIGELNIDVDNLVSSTSWRLTAPLRYIKKHTKSSAIKHVKDTAFFIVKKGFAICAKRLMIFVNAYPELRRFIVIAINSVGLLGALKKFYYKVSSLDSPVSDVAHKKLKFTQLAISPISRKVFLDLQREIKKLKGDV